MQLIPFFIAYFGLSKAINYKLTVRAHPHDLIILDK